MLKLDQVSSKPFPERLMKLIIRMSRAVFLGTNVY